MDKICPKQPWVTRPERPKGAKEKVKRPEEPPARRWEEKKLNG